MAKDQAWKVQNKKILTPLCNLNLARRKEVKIKIDY